MNGKLTKKASGRLRAEDEEDEEDEEEEEDDEEEEEDAAPSKAAAASKPAPPKKEDGKAAVKPAPKPAAAQVCQSPRSCGSSLSPQKLYDRSPTTFRSHSQPQSIPRNAFS